MQAKDTALGRYVQYWVDTYDHSSTMDLHSAMLSCAFGVLRNVYGQPGMNDDGQIVSGAEVAENTKAAYLEMQELWYGAVMHAV